MEQLLALDRELFLLINGLHTPFWDSVMVFCSAKLTWVPFYIALLLLVWWRVGWRAMLWFLVGIVVTVLLADQLSVHLFKNTVQRLRPCHVAEIAQVVHLPRGHCGGAYGFLSSHAANVFGVALMVSLFARLRWVTWVVFFWAAIVSYSRIYMGVHYPGDVLCGALWGLLVGMITFLALRYVYRRWAGRHWKQDARSPLAH